MFVFSRGSTTGPAYAAAAAQLLEFDADGRFVREIGKNLYAWSFAHTVRVDRDDNIWCTDKGSDVVVKFSPEGKVLMVLGRKQEASDEDTAPLKHPKPPLPAEDGRFRQVTDVTWDPAGNIFVSDGYINSRVAKIDKNGNWVTSWGTRGDKPGEFNTPHSIAADAQGNVYVADRFNRRIQVFDGDGKFLRAMTIDVPFDRATRPVIGNPVDPNATSGTFSPGAPCGGKAATYKYAGAKQAAETAASGGKAWRIPSREELVALVDKTSKKKPLIDAKAFPNTPKAAFWALREGSDDDLNAWLVSFSTGRVSGNAGQKKFPLRLVRSGS